MTNERRSACQSRVDPVTTTRNKQPNNQHTTAKEKRNQTKKNRRTVITISLSCPVPSPLPTALNMRPCPRRRDHLAPPVSAPYRSVTQFVAQNAQRLRVPDAPSHPFFILPSFKQRAPQVLCRQLNSFAMFIRVTKRSAMSVESGLFLAHVLGDIADCQNPVPFHAGAANA